MESNIEKLKRLFGMKKDEIVVPEQTEDYDINMSVTVSNSSAGQSSTMGTMMGGAGGAGGSYIVSAPTTGYTYTLPVTTAIGGGPGYYSIGSGITFSMPTRTNIVSLNDANGKEIVRINMDGSVTWADGIKIDEAAEAMSKSMSNAVELQAGITKAVKLRMRDSVFEDIIEIARQKGSLTADDLTYLLEASKIVEKLKGAKD